MLKFGAGLLVASLVTMLSATTVEQGLRDATESMMVWSYFEVRDMRQTVMLDPQKTIVRTPSELSVPTIGKEHVTDLQTLARTLTNPVPASAASIADGDSTYRKICTPCHGPNLKGNGPVAPFFIPPPDLQAQGTRDRSDGYIYSYIRNGGAVMPSYGFQLSSEQVWNVVNFIRNKQRTEPR